MSASANFTYTPTAEQTPMIISHLAKAHISYDTFQIVFHFDLQKYYEQSNTLGMCLTSLKILSNRTKDEALSAIVGQLKLRHDLVQNEEELLNTFRSKRDTPLCSFCGDMQHFLYGTMTGTQAEEWAQVVNAIRNGTIRNHDLIKNQTVLLQGSLKYNQAAINKLERKLNTIMKNITFKFNETDNELVELRELVRASNLAQIAHLAFDEHSRLYGQIRRALNDVRKGKIPELISKQEFIDQLKMINSHLKGTQTLPVDITSSKSLEIFKFSKIFTSLHGKKLMLEVNIPITEREQFNLYKTTPIPLQTKYGTMIAKAFSSHYLLNLHMTQYIRMDADQLGRGIMMAPNEMLYKPTTCTMLKSDKICEWKIQTESDPNDIIYACQFSRVMNKG